MSLAHNSFLQRVFGGGIFERLWLGVISRVQLFLLGKHKDKEIVRRIRQVRRERRSLLTAYEAFTIHAVAKGCCVLPGEMAEVGVFQGGSAKLLCEIKGDKALHLFDTFEGLPPAAAEDKSVHRPSQYACSLESVSAYLREYDNVHFYPGLFPDSAAEVPEQKYCFAHFDVDLYEGTLACLDYFYPRMVTGGVMVSHDYSLLAGVRQAFDEFFANRVEKPIEQPSTQCMIIKLPEGNE